MQELSVLMNNCYISHVTFYSYSYSNQYALGGDDHHEFYIGRDNGNVLLAKNLDWETRREYNLTISITDGVHTVTTQLYITVLGNSNHNTASTMSVFKC